jgi:TonB family protein
MKRPNLISHLVVVALLCMAASAQSPPAAVSTQSPPAAAGHFSKDGVSFDYLAGWSLDDKSSENLQHLILRRADSSALVMVIVQREPVRTPEQIIAARATVTMPYVASLARSLGARTPSQEDAQCLPVGERFAVGFRLAGKLEREPGTGEVYVIVLGQRLVHLVYVRADKDDAVGAAGWKTVLDTLKVEPPANPSPDADRIEKSAIVMGGVLNGRALKKPQPDYPAMARRERAQGVVVVQVVVDENGNVISAVAVSGHPLLQVQAVGAARMAKFTPTTLCGKPVKVSGLITYNFVLR